MHNFTIGHMRKLVNLAFDHVEILRAQKAHLEMVEHVPSQRPVDLFYVDQCTKILKDLAAEKRAIESWHKAGHAETGISSQGFSDLSKDMQLFDVSLMASAHQGSIEIAIREKQGRNQ